MLEFDGSKLKKIRKDRGMLQRELAVVVGKQQSHVANYENGVADPPADTLLSLIHFLQIRPEDLAKSST